MTRLAPDWRVDSPPHEARPAAPIQLRPARRPTLWFEIDDIVRHFDRHCHPMGIQRVCIEMLNAALMLYPERVRLVRLCRVSNRFVAVPAEDFRREVARAEAAARRWAHVARPLGKAFRLTRQLMRGIARLAEDTAWRVSPLATAPMRPGDVLVSLGASWNRGDFPAVIGGQLRAIGVRMAFLLHDIIPLSRPEFAHNPSHVAHFRGWLHQMLEVSDLVVTSSHYSRTELLGYCRRSGWDEPRLEVVPFGAGFHSSGVDYALARRLAHEPYVLCVSTIEVRKNHALLVEVWRRLIERHGADKVPLLVLVGEVGWGVGEFMREFRATGGLGGKIVIRSQVVDAALQEAYRGALFTVYPSLHEGWGLPVSESLEKGTVCLCSNVTSLPEIGGDLVTYFDPLDADEAYTRIEAMLFDTAARDAAALRIRNFYRRRSWETCLRELVGHIDGL